MSEGQQALGGGARGLSAGAAGGHTQDIKHSRYHSTQTQSRKISTNTAFIALSFFLFSNQSTKLIDCTAKQIDGLPLALLICELHTHTHHPSKLSRYRRMIDEIETKQIEVAHQDGGCAMPHVTWEPAASVLSFHGRGCAKSSGGEAYVDCGAGAGGFLTSQPFAAGGVLSPQPVAAGGGGMRVRGSAGGAACFIPKLWGDPAAVVPGQRGDLPLQ